MNSFLKVWIAPSTTPHAASPLVTQRPIADVPVTDQTEAAPAVPDGLQSVGEPEEVALWKQILNATVTEPRPYATPTPLFPVRVVVGDEQVPLRKPGYYRVRVSGFIKKAGGGGPASLLGASV